MAICSGTAAQRLGAPAPAGAPAAADAPAPALRGVPLTRPTRLSLLVEGQRYDIDAASARAAGITSWLRPVTGPPIFLAETGLADEVGRIRLSIGSWQHVPGFPVYGA